MTMYFWFENGEDGTSIRPMKKAEVEREIAQRIEDECPAYFLAALPEIDKGSWMDVPENAVLILKGEIVLPKPVRTVERYEV